MLKRAAHPLPRRSCQTLGNMNAAVFVAGIALLAAVVLYGVGQLLVRSLLRALGWRSPFRSAVVLSLWFGSSTLVVLPLFAMLLAQRTRVGCSSLGSSFVLAVPRCRSLLS